MENGKISYKVRLATTEDAEAVLNIYSHYIHNSVSTFELETPSIDEMKGRIRKILIDMPWLVCEDENGTIQGYAYAFKYRDRPAYQWTAETSVYVSHSCIGLGIGEKLYGELFSIILKQGYYKVIALAAGDNEKSTKFHLKMGFTRIGTGSNIGYKFGKWVDVHWFQKDLKIIKDNPVGPVPYYQI